MSHKGNAPEIPLETFSKVVEAIYDCALDPNHWRKALGMLVELSRSTGSNLFNVNYLKGYTEFAIHVGMEERFVRLHDEIYGAINPHFAPLQSVPVGKVVTSAMLVDPRELHKSKFYREFLKPAGIRDSVGFNVLKTNYRLGVLVCFRSESQSDYKEADVRLFSCLAPHVCRSMAISDAFNLKTVRSEALEATLNALASGVYLADCDGRIIYMNPAAERQVEKGDAVRIENNRLTPIDRMARVALAGTIGDAVTDEAITSESGFSLALPTREGAGLIATILPLSRGERRNTCGAFAAMAAIFVQDPIVVPAFPGEAFAKLYGLTGSELRVLLAMAPGLTVKEATEVLGISEATAKTHLQHIYAKTNTSKQTELMHLFARSTPPVKGA